MCTGHALKCYQCLRNIAANTCANPNVQLCMDGMDACTIVVSTITAAGQHIEQEMRGCGAKGTAEAIKSGKMADFMDDLMNALGVGTDITNDVTECYSNLCNSAVHDSLPGLVVPMMVVAIMAFFKLF